MASHYVGFRPARTFQFQQKNNIYMHYMIYNELYIYNLSVGESSWVFPTMGDDRKYLERVNS